MAWKTDAGPRRLALLAMQALLLALMGGGCRYSFTGASVPADVKTFSVPQVENQAAVVNPIVAQLMTERLRDKFQQQGRLRLVPREGDLQITVTITSYELAPLAVQNNTAARSRLSLRAKVTFDNVKYPDQNWDQNFENFADFDATTSLAAVERTLLEAIIDRVTQDIVNKALSDW